MAIADRNGTPEQRSEYFRQLQKKSRANVKYSGLGSPNIDPEVKRRIHSMGGKASTKKSNKGTNERDSIV